MRYIQSVQKWTNQVGYQRGILLPFGDKEYHGVQVQLTQIASGDKVSKHYHLKQTEIIYFLEGSCDYFFENATITIHPGELLIINPREVHSTINNSGITARFLTLKISGVLKDTVWE